MIRVILCAWIAASVQAAQVPPVPPQVDEGFVNASVGQDGCLFATPTIPGACDFPSSFTLSGQYAIIDDRQVVADESAPVTVSIFPHPGAMTGLLGYPVGMPACDELVFSITIGGGVQMTLGPVPTSTFARTDLVIGTFTRTWLTPATSQDPPRQFWRHLDALQNRPILFLPTFTDMLLDFGNQVDRVNDHLQAGEPGYTNIVWMISR